MTRSALDFYSRPVDLVPGDETDDYEVTGRPFTQPDGQVRVQVAYFADPWRAGFVCGDADDVVHGERLPARFRNSVICRDF